MNLAALDTSATTGTSVLHRCSPAAKLACVAGVITAVVISRDAALLAGLTVAMLAAAVACGLPWRRVVSLAAYPALFALLFAFAATPTPAAAALVVAKAVTAAMAGVVLMHTTPYPQVFAPIQRVVPATIGDALLMTYRSLFLLLERFSHTLTAARLRAGLVGPRPIRSAATVTRSLGSVLLYSIDLSQRTHDVMALRGYDGRLAVTIQHSASRPGDVAVLGLGTLAPAAAVAGVLLPTGSNAARLAPLGLACLLLAGAIVSATLRKARR
jgi:energy-coupling factor transporter transmembrane protein EcfT